MGQMEDVRLHVVSGKGGVGKTTVAAALAISLAHEGKHVLLVEVENRHGIARLFGREPLPYEEVPLIDTGDGGKVSALAIDPEAAFAEYLDIFYNMRLAGTVLRTLGAIEFVTTIAPGTRDVLLTGKVKETVERHEADRPVYDAVVLDAPPTGRLVRFLNVTSDVAGLAAVGAVNKQALSVIRLLRSDACAVHLVATPEELPVREALDAIDELRAAQLPVGRLIVNRERTLDLTVTAMRAAAAGTVDTDLLARGLDAAGLRATPAAVSALADALVEQAVIVDRGRRALADAKRARVEAVHLPELSGDLDLDALGTLAARLEEQGL